MKNVDGTLIVTVQHCIQGLLTTTGARPMDQGKEMENILTKTGLQPDTEHSFRACVVCGSEVSEWSDVVKGRTKKMPFEASGWKECPEDVDDRRKVFC